MSEAPNEVIARALYAEEKRRAEHANALIGATGECMEPYEECADSCWRNDANAAISALEAAGWKCVRDEGAYPRAFVEFVLRHTWPERAKAHGHEAVHDIIKNHPFAQMYAPASASNPKEKPDV